ncbi:MAG: hypothetical protein H6812_04015 [Phycisphaeraceae bacterium]|nr:hypothetical protein [Phycisphaeraceae bacterium]
MSTRAGRIAALGALVVASGAQAFTWYGVSGQNVVWPGATSVRYLYPGTFPPGSEIHELMLSAMGEWSIVPKSRFFYQYADAEEDYEPDHFDGFSDTLAVPASELDPGTIGVTFLVNNGAQWYDMDIFFADAPDDVGYNFETNPSCDALMQPVPNNGYNFSLSAMHELGHAIGLGHDPVGNEAPGTPWFVATMNPAYPSGGTSGGDTIELHGDDRAGARFLYPYSGPAQPAVRDLSLAMFTTSPFIGQVQPIYFTPGSAGPGGAVFVRSVIENRGSVSHFDVRQGFYLSDDEVIDASDELLGYLEWDIAFEDALEFDVQADMPDDLASGLYWLGSIIDDTDLVDEVYEDNNAARYCVPLVIEQLAPVIEPSDQEQVWEGETWVSAPPVLSKPLNMGPVTWTLLNPQPGMQMNPGTGVIRWANAVHSPFLYTLNIRATNGAGTDTGTVFLGVLRCEGDTNMDRVVDVDDLNNILASWGQVVPAGTLPDLSGDGLVNVTDLNRVLSNWGTDCLK